MKKFSKNAATIHSSAHSKSEAGHVYRYWKVTAKTGGGKKSATIHPRKHRTQCRNTRKVYSSCIKPVLQVYGMKPKPIGSVA